MKKIALSLLIGHALFANVAIPNEAYEVLSNKEVTVIHAPEYRILAKDVLDYETDVIKHYSNSYGYGLDDKQYVGLLSSCNQVANAYSSQFPLNIQINFPAGALAVDYFASSSWIKTLLWHESAHNFQLNPKKNLLNYYAHKIVKNTPFTFLAFVPLFPVPNSTISSFLLEGNAVLNESWHNNGGRLYNGALLAMVITQARAGYITPERTYNEHLYFPYRTHHYIVGGFFQLFLAQKYGIDKVNRYFYTHSGQWLPFFTNIAFQESFGEDFEKLLKEFNQWVLESYAGFTATQGALLLHSKSSVKLNGDANELYFLVSDDYTQPTLVRIDKEDGKIIKERTYHPVGKVFKYHDNYFSRASSAVSPLQITAGLFDKEGKILPESASKSVQFLDESKMVYFDIASSFDVPQMYINDTFYAQANSSVFTYHDKHYYFVQEGKRRILYENKRAIFSFKGWYGFVCDKDEDGLYFIANSRNGSALYRLRNGVVSRMSKGDDIIDMRLLNRGYALVETMGAEGVAFYKIALQETPSQVEEVRYFFEKDKRFNNASPHSDDIKRKSKPYNPMENMHYSSLSHSLIATRTGVDFDIAATFTDPFSQNKIEIFSNKLDDDIIAGVGYDNSQYRLNFGASLYGVIDHDTNESSRSFGTRFYLSYPLLHTMYEKMDMKLSYYLDSKRDEKSPLIWTLAYQNHKHFGHSMYLNEVNDITLSAGIDRGDHAIALHYNASHAWHGKIYGGVNLEGGYVDSEKEGEKRGLKILSYVSRFSNGLDFEMPSLKDTLYVKEFMKVGFSLHKVFDMDKYFFSFPLSLRREALYTRYNYYNLQLLDQRRKDFHEVTLGMHADLLFFNTLPIPLRMEYIENNNLQNANHFRVLFDLNF